MKSPLGKLAGPVLWRLVLSSWGLLALAAVLANLGSAATSALADLALVGSWLLAMRFLLADTWGRWFWLFWLLTAGGVAAAFGGPGVGGAIALSGFALTLRRLRPWRAVGPRQRAAGFGLGLVAVVLMILARPVWSEATLTVPGPLRNLGAWSLGSLAFFWAWSLFHLAVRMQLHFLRLRPKMAVSAFLIGFVPVMLVLVLIPTLLFYGLGGARAARARATLDSWRELADAGIELAPALFDTTFAWPSGGPGAAGAVAVAAPDWVPAAAARLPQGRGEDLRAAPPDTTAWLAGEGQLWLVRWRGLGTADARARGWLLGDRALQALSRQMHAGVKLAPVGPGRGDGSIQLGDQMPLDGRVFAGRKAVYRDVSADPAFWEEWRYFGGALVDIHRWRGGNVDEASLLLSVRTGWIDLRSEFLEGENNLNVAAVAAMGAVAFLFLVIEIFALFFGVRITEGIIAAVRTLGRGAKAVAGGDLETVIEVPNEDEFGDLAANFNEMIRAVKKGREDALARERLTREVQTAREIQDRLLPHGEPELPGFEITGCSLPSREIGGDYFDFIIQADDRVGLAIADVSGKGMPAALLMANLQASLHGQAMRRDGVAHVVSRVNDQLTASTDPHMFATFFYAELDTRTGLLTSTNAGHNPPVVVRADGAVETLGEGGLLIGMLPDQPYAQQETLLGPGDVVVLYTDGITEAAGPSAEPDDPSAMFGDDELVDVVRRHAHLPAVGIKEALLAAVARHTAGVEQSDDITLVVIRRKG